MKQITREKFDGTFFDVSEWTDEQKIKFQKRCFELNYQWSGWAAEVQELQAGRYFLSGDRLTYTNTQYESKEYRVQKFYSDMFPEENRGVRESIFDNPVWVTALCDLELTKGLELSEGVDYKVLSTNFNEKGYKLFKLINNLGDLREYCEGHFHKVSPEDLLPVEEYERGFDGLVVNPSAVPENFNWVIPLSHLSKEQLNFMEEIFNTDNRYTPWKSEDEVIMGCFEDNDAMWSNTYEGFMPSEYCKIATFNTLFQYEEDL